MSEVDSWLKQGMTALRAGNKEEARSLLMRVLEVDEQHEQAWLWLSGAMETADERQICLENVLTINPDSEVAQRGLAKLGVTWPKPDDEPTAVIPESDPDEIVVRREYAAISTASALLHPESQVKEWRWQEPATHIQSDEAPIGYQQTSHFDDVWSRDADLCAYCARELEPDEMKCPRCQRDLQKKAYRYDKASNNLVIFWVLLLGVAQLFLFNGIFAFLVEGNVLTTILYGIFAVVFGVLTVAANLRQWWAHITSLIVLGLVILLAGVNALVPIDFSGLNIYVLDLGVFWFSGGIFQVIGDGLRYLLLGAVGLATIYGVFVVPSDFDRITTRDTATLRKGLSTADHYHSTARKLVVEGRLASAILHWQRAAAKDPARLIYQRHLAGTYAQLGFYERSLNIMSAMSKRTTDPQQQAKLQKMITAVQKRLEQTKS